MVKSENAFTVTERFLKLLKAWKQPVTCYRCGEPFKAGEQIVSRRTDNHHGTFRKRYHRHCWESMFLEVE